MGMLKAKPYELGDQAAMVLAQIACYKGTLPQGAPTSPIISNMVCASCDTKMIRLAQKHKLQYTRYCDDITFSTNKTQFPVAIVKVDKDGNIKIGHELARELKKSGFIVNEDKIHVRDTNKRQEVTGIVVNSFPNLKREYIRELRLILYQCQTKGVYIAAKKYIELKRTKNRHIIDISRKQYKEREKQEWQEKQITDWFLQVLKGKIEYIRCVRGDDCKYYYKYGKIYNVVFGKEIFLINDFDYKKKRWCFVMEGENDKGCVQGTGFLLREYGIVTNEHVITDQSFPFIRVINGEKDTVALITQDSDRLFSNKEIDYAVYAYNVNEGWELGNSDDVREGVTVKILSYPQYVSVDSISEVICKVTGKKKLNLQDPIWCVDKQLFHGSSGGIVLDEENKVIGVVEAGTNAFCLEDDCLSPEPSISGFIPINRIIENYKMRQ